jgi:hypothetical protein
MQAALRFKHSAGHITQWHSQCFPVLGSSRYPCRFPGQVYLPPFQVGYICGASQFAN